MNLKFEVSFPICSLDLAKRLNELGFEKPCTFYYLPSLNHPSKKPSIGMKGSFNEEYHHDAIPAYTSSELMDFLPHRITIQANEPFNSFRLLIRKILIVPKDEPVEHYLINYDCDTIDPNDKLQWIPSLLFPHSIHDENFANAIAKTLIYEIEYKLIKL